MAAFRALSGRNRVAQITGWRPSCAATGTNAPDTLSTVSICSSAVATSGALRMRSETPPAPSYSPKRITSATACGVPLTIAILPSVEPTITYSTRGCAQKKAAAASSSRLIAPYTGVVCRELRRLCSPVQTMPRTAASRYANTAARKVTATPVANPQWLTNTRKNRALPETASNPRMQYRRSAPAARAAASAKARNRMP